METRFTKFLRKITEYLVDLFVFILPWQTKLILRPGETSYSEISIYASYFLLLIVLFTFFWLRLKENQYEEDLKSIIFSVAAFGLFIFISIFFAPDKPLSFYHYFILLSGLSLFFIIRLGGEHGNYEEPFLNKIKIIYVFLTSIFFQALLGIYQFITQSSFAFKYLGLAEHDADTLGTAVVETANGRWMRAYGGMDHPNILGGVLAISLIFIAYFLAKKKMLNNRKDVISSILLFVFYFIDLFALFFTFSRSAWLALIIGLLTLLFVLIFKKDRLTLKRFIAVLFFSLILICINVAPYQDLLMARIDPQTRLEKKSIDERLAYINQASDLSKQHLISGVGVGNYGVVTAAADNNKKSAFDYQPVHNVFLLILAESGIFSLISFF